MYCKTLLFLWGCLSMKKYFCQISCFVITLIIFLSSFTLVQADESPINISPDKIEEFYEKTVKKTFDESKSVGGVFIVVKGDKIVFKKGYGYENLESKRKVTTDETLFRIGSITKTFTAAAAVQLKEKGTLDFNEDITKYLKETKIENKFKTPITMEHIFTHRSGLDTSENIFLFKELNDKKWTKEYMRNLKFIVKSEPGTVCSYNNYALGLAGVLIEDISGIPYDEYLKENIFKPLGMNNSYARINKSKIDNLAKEYSYEDGKYKPLHLYEPSIPPAGNIVTTGEDMAKYMMTFLNGGSLNGKSILSKQSTEDMFKTHFTVHESLDGMGTGFYEETINENKFNGHGGATLLTYSQMILDPKNKVGIFYSTTSGMSEAVYDIYDIKNHFVSEFYPKKDKSTQTIANPKTVVNGIEGYYVSEVMRNENGIEKLISLFMNTYVKQLENGDIVVDNAIYKSMGNNIYKNMESNGTIYVDIKNNSTYLYGSNSRGSFRKVNSISHYLQLGVVISLIVLFIASIISLIVSKFTKRKIDINLVNLMKTSILLSVICAATVFVFIMMLNPMTCYGTTKTILLGVYNFLSWVVVLTIAYTTFKSIKAVLVENKKMYVKILISLICFVLISLGYIMIYNNMLSFTRGI